MLRHYDGIPSVKQILEDWHSLYKLATKQARIKNEYSKLSVWETLERESPMHLDGFRGNEYIVVRLMYNKIDKKKYYDVRIFEVQNGILKKTDRGIYLPIHVWNEVKQCLNELARRTK